jgi:polysaccharide biosynthesis protein PslG
LRRGARFATSLGLLAVCLGLLAPAATAKAHHPKLTAAKARGYVRATLVTRGLKPRRVGCHPGGRGGYACAWRATRVVRGWQFHCQGLAWRGRRDAKVQPCRLTEPELAPLHRSRKVGNWQPSFGFNEDWLTHLSSLNFAGGLASNTNRVPFFWGAVEPQRGQFNWAGYDAVYNAMIARGMHPLLTIGDPPCWAYPRQPCRPGLSYPPDKQHLGRWAHFVKLTVSRYPGLAGIEVWNEPNLTQFWGPEANPKGYVKLLRITDRAVKSVDRSLPVVFGGNAPQFDPNPVGMEATVFERRAYKAGAGRHVDALGVHPYVYQANDPNLLPSVRLQLALLKGIAARHGYPGTPLWVTEFGVSTAGGAALTPENQAAKLVDIYEMLRRVPGVPVVILHRLLDLNPKRRDWEAGLGIVGYNGVPKPAYCALAEARTGSCPYH